MSSCHRQEDMASGGAYPLRGKTGWLAADGPGAGAGLRVEHRGAHALLLGRGSGGGTGAANRVPGALIELIEATVRAIGRDGGGVAAGLARRDRVEGRLGHAVGLRRRKA